MIITGKITFIRYMFIVKSDTKSSPSFITSWYVNHDNVGVYTDNYGYHITLLQHKLLVIGTNLSQE